MMRLALGTVLTLAVAGAASASPVGFTVVSPDTYQTFVGNWPGKAPLCAIIDSGQHWNQVMHPAPVFGDDRRPFSPDAAFWASHMLLMFAQVVPGGASAAPFTDPAVDGAGTTLSVSFRFPTPAPASFTIKGYLALAVPRSAPTSVAFTENGRRVCALRPARGAWVSPASVAR